MSGTNDFISEIEHFLDVENQERMLFDEDFENGQESDRQDLLTAVELVSSSDILIPSLVQLELLTPDELLKAFNSNLDNLDRDEIEQTTFLQSMYYLTDIIASHRRDEKDEIGESLVEIASSRLNINEVKKWFNLISSFTDILILTGDELEDNRLIDKMVEIKFVNLESEILIEGIKKFFIEKYAEKYGIRDELGSIISNIVDSARYEILAENSSLEKTHFYESLARECGRIFRKNAWGYIPEQNLKQIKQLTFKALVDHHFRLPESLVITNKVF